MAYSDHVFLGLRVFPSTVGNQETAAFEPYDAQQKGTAVLSKPGHIALGQQSPAIHSQHPRRLFRRYFIGDPLRRYIHGFIAQVDAFVKHYTPLHLFVWVGLWGQRRLDAVTRRRWDGPCLHTISAHTTSAVRGYGNRARIALFPWFKRKKCGNSYPRSLYLEVRMVYTADKPRITHKQVQRRGIIVFVTDTHKQGTRNDLALAVFPLFFQRRKMRTLPRRKHLFHPLSLL